jgi:ubiquitin-conjugating enzyme E2 G1
MSENQATLLLRKQLKDLSRNPVDGFSAGLVDDSNLFEWNVTIIGPPDTLYEGGYFNAIMSFPPNYPNSPPSVRFTSDMWHPNVYPDGRVCISILHAPGDDPNGYELASERWSPVHTVNFSCELLTVASENGEKTHHIQPCLFGYCHEHTISGNFLDRR